VLKLQTKDKIIWLVSEETMVNFKKFQSGNQTPVQYDIEKFSAIQKYKVLNARLRATETPVGHFFSQ